MRFAIYTVFLRRFFSLTLMLFLFIGQPWAQPGGGGGLRILQIYDREGKLLTRENPTIMIKHYALSDNGTKIKFQIPDSISDHYRFYDRASTFMFLPPHIRQGRKSKALPNQRICLIQDTDTMTIDFMDIINENGAGHSDMVKIIQFRSGYYKNYRNPAVKIENFGLKKERSEILMALMNGINVQTDLTLYAWGLMEYVPDPNAMNKMLERSRKSCKPEKFKADYYRLCYHNITLIDSTILLDDIFQPIHIGYQKHLKLSYYFTFHSYSIGLYKEEVLARNQLMAFEKYALKVNNELYDGTLRLAVPFIGGISTRYSGFDVWIITYSNGRVQSIEKLRDVDVINESPRIRPQ